MSARLTDGKLPASFRDPSGFLFQRDGTLFRQINASCREDYDRLMSSGLFRELTEAGLLIPHQEVDVEPAEPQCAYKILEPERIDFISYPYEWCFSQLKDAALLTLRVAATALARGMSLKDCSAYNVQFHHGKPIFIDSLSFETYRDGSPWVAYRQFCQHFLAPLALMSMTDIRLNQLLRTNLDGIPLQLASTLLPARSRLKFALLAHIHLHAKAQRKYAQAGRKPSSRVSRHRLHALLDNLRSAVEGFRWCPSGTEWADYDESSGYTDEAMNDKMQLIGEYLAQIQPGCVWDLGANTGVFSRIPSDKGIPTVSFDIDAAAVEKNYSRCVVEGRTNLLPLLLDLTNPSPAIGWHHRERASLLERGPVDAVLALALIHHLAISNNLPLENVAAFLAEAGRWLIVEFVPKSDPQVQRLLASREDVFDRYAQVEFERAFERHFTLEDSTRIRGTERRLYLMRRGQA